VFEVAMPNTHTPVKRGRFGALALLAAIVAALAFAIVGCGGSTAARYETLTRPALDADTPIAVPAKPVLTVDGRIATTNDRRALVLDMPTLERLGLIRYSVDDPWLKREIAYTGIRLSDLVRLARPKAGATSMHFLALDDYQVDISIADAERWPIMVATKLDGARMAVANGGPTRIVFPYGQGAGLDELQYKDLWIWNIQRITFR
jgi:hypothetical protein